MLLPSRVQEHVVKQLRCRHERETAPSNESYDTRDGRIFKRNAHEAQVSFRWHCKSRYDTQPQTCLNQAHQSRHVAHLAELLRLVLDAIERLIDQEAIATALRNRHVIVLRQLTPRDPLLSRKTVPDRTCHDKPLFK